MNPMMGMQGPGMYGAYFSPEDYDQIAAQLLFSLSSYQNAAAGMPGQQTVYDPNAVQMDWAQNLSALAMESANGTATAINPQPQLMLDQNGNIVQMDGVDVTKEERLALSAPDYMVLKPEEMAMYDANYAYYAALGGNAGLNVGPTADPMGKQLVSGDGTQIIVGTLSDAPSPRAGHSEHDGHGSSSNAEDKTGEAPRAVSKEEAETCSKQTDPSIQQDANPMLVPKQEPQPEAMTSDAEAMYANTILNAMLQQQQHQAMMLQQDPNAMATNQEPLYDLQALSAQYMVAPSYYPAANGLYSQLLYGDPNVPAPNNTEQIQSDLKLIYGQQPEKAIDSPPLPSNIRHSESARQKESE